MNISYKFGSLILMLFISAQSLGTPSNQVQVQSKLSQTKLVQHGANTVFVDMTFTPPEINHRKIKQRATDIIIVLDRSGSMSEG